MTPQEIAKRFRARRAGRYKGHPAWQAKCPIHRDRIASLSITEPEAGKVRVHCFAGCDDRDVLAAVGLTLRDLFADTAWKPSAETRQRYVDQERLALLERQNGLAIMAQAVLPMERNYWAAVERNSAVEIYTLRSKLYPDEAARIRRNKRAQALIIEYGFDELWSLIP